MHTVDLMEEAMALAERLGHHVRMEWMAGSGGGGCEFMGRKWIFVDLALSTRDQLEQVVGALRCDPASLAQANIHPELRALIAPRKAA